MSLLQVSGLSKRFGGVQAVRDVAFGVDPGEILGLIGPNGAGKTTVFNLVTGFISPDAGDVVLDGRPIGRWGPERRADAGLVRTFQIVKPFGNISVLDNVTIGAMLRERTMAGARAHALGVLGRVGLADRAETTARTLPIGLRKKLEVAKALAAGPRVLLLDEIMGGLIPSEVGETIELLKALRSDGIATVLIEHNMHAIMTASDRIVVLHHGQFIAEGTPERIARDPQVLSAYLGEGYGRAQDRTA